MGSERRGAGTVGVTVQQLVKQRNESDLQRAVLELARILRWRSYHTWSSMHSSAGFPDLVLVRGSRLIFAELKRETGRLTPAQSAWFEDLSQVACIETYVWRPSDLDHVARTLR